MFKVNNKDTRAMPMAVNKDINGASLNTISDIFLILDNI